jgi:hypothetical protein
MVKKWVKPAGEACNACTAKSEDECKGIQRKQFILHEMEYHHPVIRCMKCNGVFGVPGIQEIPKYCTFCRSPRLDLVEKEDIYGAV